ncbi:glutathione synthase [Grimontia hollisae]|uniref:glutathione synthase n=2 Tax=Grimontia hollisae TaxID=673 RepID=D0I9C9_GRIHO|nr:glutathione synthase [Grimontia hollisae]AMG29395.1 glutathione synthase [Grimontia hollisae]EEY72044.1 glutathione synthetase [Grimontia hollisae CIP 101886]MDF2184033.1 glutathione synthase [Grimontia hollisae]STO77585.1 glutathione synthetase [Grimontia hollisae]STO98550.1 glutathione synthetase [Grimontia hollisae]
MAFRNTEKAKNEAVEWALTHGMALKQTPDSARHPAFTLTPTAIERERFEYLVSSVHLLGKLVHAVSEDAHFIHHAISPMTAGNTFFRALLKMHRQIHHSDAPARRVPLLMMRSDFMDDAELGPKLVEFNGIAAGMGPFGQRIHELHDYLAIQWPTPFVQWAGEKPGELVENRALERLAEGVAQATQSIKDHFGDGGRPTFLMVVQEREDNVYDQHLLEHALQARGIRTVRRTFRELYDGLSTGEGHRLLLDGIGPIDTVYLRAGYQFSDYVAHDIVDVACCEALSQTRVMIEKHHVAVNATVSQQLATSKRVQMLLSSAPVDSLMQFGLTKSEAETVKHFLGEMVAVDENSAQKVSEGNVDDWVLKNQGEGGGHCIFGDDIITRLNRLGPHEYGAWALMRRLHPIPRPQPAYMVRKGEIYVVDDLISEIGLFTMHLNGEPLIDNNGYAGYLIRSKSSKVTEGGVHSGMGALDSLMFTGK